MPVLLIASLAAFEFGMLGLLIQAGTTAVVEGTREGAKAFPAGLTFDDGMADPTGDNDIADKIALCIEQYLALHCIEVGNNDANRTNARVVIERGDGAGSGTFSTANRGDTTNITCVRTGAAPTDDEIVVTVCFNIIDSATTPTNGPNLIPDCLSAFGIDLAECRFEMTSRANLE